MRWFKRRCYALLVWLSLSSSACLAGPPFFTDDPVPVDRGHWEINNYASGTLAKGALAGVSPGVDANYGAVDNLQLHLQVPLALAQSTGVNAQWGLGDVEVGAKYRFLPADEKDWWPQIAFYPFLDFPTGNADRGLGTGAIHAFFPIWLQKDFGFSTVVGTLPCPAARSEQSRARRVAASMVANRQVRRRRLVVGVSPKPNACAGAPIGRGFGRSEVTTKPDLTGQYLLAAKCLVTS